MDRRPHHELLYPYRFRPQAIPKPWAGNTARLLKPGIGELVLLADLDELCTPIAGGSADGMRIAEVAQTTGWPALLGMQPSHGFPLLLKLLDTAAPLSVQVHPADGDGSQPGKHECWLALHADAGTVIYHGVPSGIDAERFWREVTGPNPQSVLRAVPIARGDFLDSPPGTVHAIGGGLTLLELQQNANVTLRINDWNRSSPHGDRDLDLDAAMRVSRLRMPLSPPLHALHTGSYERRILREGTPFSCVSRRLAHATRWGMAGVARVLMVLEGRCTLRVRAEEGQREHALPMAALDLVLIPACYETLEIVPDDACWLFEAWPESTPATSSDDSPPGGSTPR